MISRTTNATLSRKTSACSDRMISSTAPRAAVILWPSAIVVLLRQFLAGTDDHEARGGRTTLSPARLLHHFYRLDPPTSVRKLSGRPKGRLPGFAAPRDAASTRQPRGASRGLSDARRLPF